MPVGDQMGRPGTRRCGPDDVQVAASYVVKSLARASSIPTVFATAAMPAGWTQSVNALTTSLPRTAATVPPSSLLTKMVPLAAAAASCGEVPVTTGVRRSLVVSRLVSRHSRFQPAPRQGRRARPARGGAPPPATTHGPSPLRCRRRSAPIDRGDVSRPRPCESRRRRRHLRAPDPPLRYVPPTGWIALAHCGVRPQAEGPSARWPRTFGRHARWHRDPLWS